MVHNCPRDYDDSPKCLAYPPQQTDVVLLSELQAERDALKQEYRRLRSRSQALYDLLSRLRESSAFMAELDDGSGAAPARKVRRCAPNLLMLKQVGCSGVPGWGI